MQASVLPFAISRRQRCAAPNSVLASRAARRICRHVSDLCVTVIKLTPARGSHSVGNYALRGPFMLGKTDAFLARMFCIAPFGAGKARSAYTAGTNTASLSRQCAWRNRTNRP